MIIDKWRFLSDSKDHVHALVQLVPRALARHPSCIRSKEECPSCTKGKEESLIGTLTGCYNYEQVCGIQTRRCRAYYNFNQQVNHSWKVDSIYPISKESVYRDTDQKNKRTDL